MRSQLGKLKGMLEISAPVASEVEREDDAEERQQTGAGSPGPVQRNVGPKPESRPVKPLRRGKQHREAEKNQPASSAVAAQSQVKPKASGASKMTAKSKPTVIDFEKKQAEAAQRVRAVVAESTPSIEKRPLSISPGSKDRIDLAVVTGARILRERPSPDEDGYIIGFDFGTSSLKVAYRQPYVAGDPVAVIAVPDELRSEGHAGLWQSVIWYHPQNGTFSLYPEKDAVALDGFKTGLIAGAGDKPMRQAPQVTRAEAATAFLALYFAYMVGAYDLERPLYPVGADHFVLVNIGIPVAVCDDKRALDEFSRLVSAGYALAPDISSLSLDAVKRALAQEITKLPSFVQLVPELTAAIAGYAADPMVQPGAHILLDVGASTLDIVAFNLQSQLRASVFTAGVDLFGAGALEIARKADIDDQMFMDACYYLFEKVYGNAKHDKRAPSLFKPGRRSMPVQLVITGGGCETEVHKRYIHRLPREKVLGALPLKRPSPPSKVLKEKGDPSRLLLAYGLTRDVTELYNLRLPSEIEDISPRQVPKSDMIDKDMV